MASLTFSLIALISLVRLFLPAQSQIQTGCTSAMLTSFTPCMNFVTNSTGNGVSPTAGCCTSLKSLMSNGTDCMCLIATGNVPFQIPINRTMAASLPKACNMPGVPLQCKAAAAPVPAPGPTAFGPASSPTTSTSPSSAAAEPSPATSGLAPEADSTPDLTPPSPTGTSGTPSTDTSATPAAGNTGSRPVLTPSTAGISYQFSPVLLFAMLAATLIKAFY